MKSLNINQEIIIKEKIISILLIIIMLYVFNTIHELKNDKVIKITESRYNWGK